MDSVNLKTLEIIEETGMLKLESIEDLNAIWILLEKMGYELSISPDTNYLIVE